MWICANSFAAVNTVCLMFVGVPEEKDRGSTRQRCGKTHTRTTVDGDRNQGQTRSGGGEIGGNIRTSQASWGSV